MLAVNKVRVELSSL